MDNTEIQSILKALGERVPSSSRLVLIGGSALALLGSPRLTIDIDFVGDDINPSKLARTVMQIAKELNIDIEPVPLNDLYLCPREATNVRFILVDLVIWMFMWQIHTALHSASWIGALIQISMILSFLFNRTMWFWKLLSALQRTH